MNKKDLRIGIALSGGGIRATVFHLGVLKYLAEQGLMKNVSNISSVSGASLCVGLILSQSRQWPSDKEYLEKVLPNIEKIILKHDIQLSALLRLPFSPCHWKNRVGLIARVLETKWKISGTLQDIPDSLHWEINCTTFETGKRFRFRKDYMGDYKLGYARRPDLPIADVIAASAGFPILIGPYKLKTSDYQWSSDKFGKDRIEINDNSHYLWDGGVYDNLGLEALYKIGKGLDGDINYLITSNAFGGLEYMRYQGRLRLTRVRRLIDIAMEQVGSLRSRDLNAAVVKPGNGLYIKIGNTAQTILQEELWSPNEREKLIKECMLPSQALKVKNYATTLRTPSKQNYQLILQHGYENAKCTCLNGGLR